MIVHSIGEGWHNVKPGLGCQQLTKPSHNVNMTVVSTAPKTKQIAYGINTVRAKKIVINRGSARRNFITVMTKIPILYFEL